MSCSSRTVQKVVACSSSAWPERLECLPLHPAPRNAGRNAQKSRGASRSSTAPTSSNISLTFPLEDKQKLLKEVKRKVISCRKLLLSESAPARGP